MADLRVPCPMCQTLLSGPASAAGKRVKCKKCGHSFTAGITAEQIKAARQTEPPAFDADEAEAFGIQREPVPPAPAMGPTITYVCDRCGKHGLAPAHNAGMVFGCECGGVIEVPALAEAIPVRHDRPREPEGRRTDVAVFAWLLAVGGLLGLIFFLFMDTTVPSGGAFGFPDRVHNIGLMHQRTTGIAVSGGALVLGVILHVLGPKK